MNGSGIAAVITAGVIAVLFILMILKGKRDRNSDIQKKIRNSWGSELPRLYSAEQISHIRRYSDSLDIREEAPAFCVIDEITAGDTALDEVYGTVSRTFSAPGDEVLYAWLRHPLTDPEAVRKRIALEDFFAENAAAREEAGRILCGCGRLRKASFYGALASLEEARSIGRGKYLLLSAVTVLTFLMLLVRPVVFAVLAAPVLFIDFRVHLGMKKVIGESLAGFQAVLRLVQAAREMGAMPYPEMTEETEKLRRAAAAFSSFRRGSFLVMTAGSVGSGFSDAVLEYANMLFHADLIRYDAMLAAYRTHEKEAEELFAVLGSVDAAISAASYKASGRLFTRPVFTDGTAAVFRAEELYHPLLNAPVPNSVDTEREVLLTGSNASGKSTFLKSVALSAILAQSIGIVPARSYEAPCFAVFSSMALSDNLAGGESYFVVEIRSLKRIWDAAQSGGQPVLAVIDEVLRGTNTVERIASSAQILKALDRRNVLIFAATHDIELSYLLEDCYTNMHFEEHIEDGDVRFDYRLRTGRASSGNAVRLIGAAGFGPEITEEAERMAKHFNETGEWRF